MPSFSFAYKARLDMRGIYNFSADMWGVEQAGKYTQSLNAAMQRLAENPGKGAPADHFRKGYFRHRHQRHQIFYLKAAHGIHVVRVLHDSMDFRRHL